VSSKKEIKEMNKAVRVLVKTIITSSALLIAWPGSALSAEFSADLIRSSGADSETSKVYIKGDLRREEVMEEGKIGAVSIIRPDKRVIWNLIPEEQMYMEIPLGAGMSGAHVDVGSLEASAKMQVLGKETVSGYACEKRRFDYHDKTQGSVTMWYSSKLDYPVKTQIKGYGGEADMVMEYKNIKAGKIPDSKFEIPKGYEKFVIPGMPGGMPGGMPEIPGMGR
jgi:outer membrane lipoprotein-sorting protein